MVAWLGGREGENANPDVGAEYHGNQNKVGTPAFGRRVLAAGGPRRAGAPTPGRGSGKGHSVDVPVIEDAAAPLSRNPTAQTTSSIMSNLTPTATSLEKPVQAPCCDIGIPRLLKGGLMFSSNAGNQRPVG